MDLILYQIFKIISIYSRLFRYILKKHEENIDKPSIRIYVNKIENRITFKITEITEVVLVHCNIVNNDYQQVFRSVVHFRSK